MAFKDTKEGDIWIPKPVLHFLESFLTDDYKYHKNPDGYLVGIDGFVCPKNYSEFQDRYPDYVMAYTYKLCHKVKGDNLPQDQWDDLVGDMVVHILTISERSSLYGEVPDRIAAFDPQKQHGAKKGQFFNWVNTVINNQFNTIVYHQRPKDPMQYSVPIPTDRDSCGDDEERNRSKTYKKDPGLISDPQADILSNLNVQGLLNFALSSISNEHRLKAGKVLNAFLIHNTHKDVAEELNIPTKEVSNILSKIRSSCKMTRV